MPPAGDIDIDTERQTEEGRHRAQVNPSTKTKNPTQYGNFFKKLLKQKAAHRDFFSSCRKKSPMKQKNPTLHRNHLKKQVITFNERKAMGHQVC